LETLLRNPVIGHPYTRVFQCAKEIYDAEKQRAIAEGRSMENFRLRLLNRSDVLARGQGLDPAIHPHRTLTPAEINHLAQVEFYIKL